MIVVDAAVFVAMLGYADGRGRKARAAMGRDPEWAAPEHWRVEVFSVLRCLRLGGKITEAQAARAVHLLPRLGVETVAVTTLLPEMWRLRANVSGYDAAYVALAAERGLTLLTGDARLASAASAHCRVELVA